MEQVKEFIKPELIILIPVIYSVGVGLKHTQEIKDNYIPAILGVCGVVLSTLWVIATCDLMNYKDFVMGVFTAITQGILVSAGAVYVNQVVKQSKQDK